jgi:hypothetical protein
MKGCERRARGITERNGLWSPLCCVCSARVPTFGRNGLHISAVLPVIGATEVTPLDEILQHNLTHGGGEPEQPRGLSEPQRKPGHFAVTPDDHRLQHGTVRFCVSIRRQARLRSRTQQHVSGGRFSWAVYTGCLVPTVQPR